MFDSSDEEQNENGCDEPLSFDWLDLYGDGSSRSVALSGLPGCRFQQIRQNLNKDLDKLERENITDVIVLVSRGELHKYRVPNLIVKYDSRGFNVHHYPMVDGSVPSIDTMMSILLSMKRLIDANKRILIHCMASLGRSSVVASCLLQYVNENMTPDATISLLKYLRGSRAVQSLRQHNFIQDFRDLHHNWLTEDLEECVSR